jgi:hypothetical protein
MRTIINALILLTLAVILQIAVFRFAIFSGGWAIVFFHLYGLTMLPVGWNKTSYLLIGALTGICIDLFMLAGGLHMAAGTLLGLALPHIASLVAPREGFQKGHVIIGFKDGWTRYIIYSFLITFVYSFSIFFIESGQLGFALEALGKAALSTGLTLAILVLTHGLIGVASKTKRSKVSAYPWS